MSTDEKFAYVSFMIDGGLNLHADVHATRAKANATLDRYYKEAVKNDDVQDGSGPFIVVVPIYGAVSFYGADPEPIPGIRGDLAVPVEALVRDLAALNATDCGPRIARLVRRAQAIVKQNAAFAPVVEIDPFPPQKPEEVAAKREHELKTMWS